MIETQKAARPVRPAAAGAIPWRDRSDENCVSPGPEFLTARFTTALPRKLES